MLSEMSGIDLNLKGLFKSLTVLCIAFFDVLNDWKYPYSLLQYLEMTNENS